MSKPNGSFLSHDAAPLARRATGLVVRQGASREELRTFQEMHRQALSVRVEKLIAAVAIYSVADLAKLTEHIGLDLILHAQHTMGRAEATLNPEYLVKFQAFAERSLGQGAHDVLEIQALAKENVIDIIADSPNFRELPPEHKSWLRRIFGG